MARVLVAMSGGVDSSVAAALCLRDGHEVVGVTMKLWGGESDTGCCSVADVEDARYVAGQLGISHRVLNLTQEFSALVVDHYVDGYGRGETPNPCIECNRSIKFDILVDRARVLGFDYVATGHHARIATREGTALVARGKDPKKDQSYVLSMIPPKVSERLMFPVGEYDKSAVREMADEWGLRTATKPDSQDVCFISRESSPRSFVTDRIGALPATIVDVDSACTLGEDADMKTVTIGQRRRVGGLGDGLRRYVIEKDLSAQVIYVGTAERLKVSSQPVGKVCVHRGDLPLRGLVQVSAHGRAVEATLTAEGLIFSERQRMVAPGQTVAFYQQDAVVASAIVTGASRER